MGDLLEPEYFAERLKAALDEKNMELKMLGLDTYDFQTVYDRYMEIAKILGPRIVDTSDLINKALRSDKKDPLRGRTGHDALYRPWHVSLRDILHPVVGKRARGCRNIPEMDRQRARRR